MRPGTFGIAIGTLALLCGCGKEGPAGGGTPPAPPAGNPAKVTVPLSCTIAADKKAYKLGEVPKITVTITNDSGRDIWLVGSLDGSDVRWRYPYCYYEITAPEGWKLPGMLRCGNMKTLRGQDFVSVPAGEDFYPFGKRASGSYQISKRAFGAAGRYTLRFVYSTESDDIKAWTGDGPIADDEDTSGSKMTKLFLWVPKTTVKSNTITIHFSAPAEGDE